MPNVPWTVPVVLLRGPPQSATGCMDELAAAAAVMAVSVDVGAEAEETTESTIVTASGDRGATAC